MQKAVHARRRQSACVSTNAIVIQAVRRCSLSPVQRIVKPILIQQDARFLHHVELPERKDFHDFLERAPTALLRAAGRWRNNRPKGDSEA